MHDADFPFEDAELADALGLTPVEFAGLPLYVQVFCREFAAVTS